MLIRRLREDDFAAWKHLRLEAVRTVPEAFGESYQDVLQHDLEWFQTSLQKGQLFGGFVDTLLVALVGFYPAHGGNMKHRAVLFSLYVTAEYRGGGIANALIERVIQESRKSHSQLHLSVTTNNTNALALYQKLGFRIYGTALEALCVNGVYFDEHLMMKKI